MQRPRCICLTAPTASGKTELALRIAEAVPLEVISMDSAMVYRGMDIGTAKPSREQRAAVAHHLIDICDPLDSYSAGRFVADVTRLAGDIAARGRLPLIVGGTMMYLRALRSGLARLPQGSPVIRAEIDAQAQRLGWPALHAQLADVDPASAARISPADSQRIQRALEVWRVTGRTLTALLGARGAAPALQITTISLLPEDRAALRA
ncbi:MAG TPA: tRNA (adenosine(37)-N6)-dimethylallyltransferase MiaA, partial [Gammaproteobacteria bacterium]|nr:tRNA (adenosine(37)-N6)-dimethylallyltransferase MiaA [Gammaproteobacteria bacterium]